MQHCEQPLRDKLGLLGGSATATPRLPRDLVKRLVVIDDHHQKIAVDPHDPDAVVPIEGKSRRRGIVAAPYELSWARLRIIIVVEDQAVRRRREKLLGRHIDALSEDT